MTTESQHARPSRFRLNNIRDDVAYILPMAAFIGITVIAGQFKSLMPIGYIVKTILAGILLYVCWPHYTKIRWTHLALGVLVGVVGVFEWIYVEKGLQHWKYLPELSHDNTNPLEQIPSPTLRMTFLIFRLLGPALVVPPMEELFWRDFVWRTFISPNDFKLARVGEWDRNVFIIIALVFASEHVQWITAIGWAVMIGILLVKTKSLGACIIAHGVTNFLLGVYVLHWHDWAFW